MTERDKRYAKTEKGKAARARAQAKWRQSKPKGKRGPKPTRVAVPYTDEDRQRDKQNMEALEAEKQRKREEFEQNPPVQAPNEESRDKQVHRLMWLFEHRRNVVSLAGGYFLTTKTRNLLSERLMQSNPLFDGIVEWLAKDFLSKRPTERWLKQLDALRYGDSDSHDRDKFFSRAEVASLMLGGYLPRQPINRVYRKYVKELRELKTQREEALLTMIAVLKWRNCFL